MQISARLAGRERLRVSCRVASPQKVEKGALRHRARARAIRGRFVAEEKLGNEQLIRTASRQEIARENKQDIFSPVLPATRGCGIYN